jgi:AraC family transcriptional activator FtrA
MPADAPNLSVACAVYDGLSIFEFGVAVDVFGLSRPELDAWYAFDVCGVRPGRFRAAGGATIVAKRGLAGIRRAGTIVLPGWQTPDKLPPTALLSALRQAHRRGARIVSLCSGVFVAAAAGLLDHKRATTHWRYAEHLCTKYPAIEVQPDVLYVDEGSVLTSAGSAAGIDLCLHLVRHDFGAEKANLLARSLVVPPHRDGGQRQFIPQPLPNNDPHDLAELMDWVRARLKQHHSVASLAARASMSQRTLARRFEEVAGTSPGRWLTRERVFHAQRLLETGSLQLERVAYESGFESAQLLRHHFRRAVGVSPSVYRKEFRQQSYPNVYPG